jgi:ketosteroid isomerase-like protein
MKAKSLLIATFVSISPLGIGAQAPRSPAEEAVWKADAAWAEASASNNVEKMVAFYDPNAVFVGTTPATSGLDQLRALWTKFFARPGYRLTWMAERVEVAASGELAFSYGPWEQTELRDGVPRTSKGTYVAVWKRQADGTWKVLVDKP